MTLDVLIVGLIVSTAHINPPPGTTNDTPGIYVRANDWAGGYYLNSWRYPSWWIGRAFDCGPVECLVGAANRFKAGKGMRLDALGLQALRDVVEVYRQCLVTLTEREMAQAQQETQRRVHALPRSPKPTHEVIAL